MAWFTQYVGLGRKKELRASKLAKLATAENRTWFYLLSQSLSHPVPVPKFGPASFSPYPLILSLHARHITHFEQHAVGLKPNTVTFCGYIYVYAYIDIIYIHKVSMLNAYSFRAHFKDLYKKKVSMSATRFEQVYFLISVFRLSDWQSFLMKLMFIRCMPKISLMRIFVIYLRPRKL